MCWPAGRQGRIWAGDDPLQGPCVLSTSFLPPAQHSEPGLALLPVSPSPPGLPSHPSSLPLLVLALLPSHSDTHPRRPRVAVTSSLKPSLL